MASALLAKINAGAVDAVSAKINFRTINQGHMLYSLILDNNNGQYNGAFDANDAVEIYLNNILLFKGIVDAVKHVSDESLKWNWNDGLRVVGRDLSHELANLKYTKEFLSALQIDEMIDMAFWATGCSIGFAGCESPTIGGHTSVDQYLFDLLREILTKAGWEAYVDTAKDLQYFAIGDASRTTGLTISNSNCFEADFTEIDGADIRTYIEVFGQAILNYPLDDAWAESLSNWEALLGTKDLSDDHKVGSYSILGLAQADGELQKVHLWRSIPTIRMIHDQFNTLYFWTKINFPGEVDKQEIRLYRDVDNYFYCELGAPSDSWEFWKVQTGKGAEYNEETNPEGYWKIHGSPNWFEIKYIGLYVEWSMEEPTDQKAKIDGLYFYPKRTYGVADVSNTYGKRELTKITNARTNTDAQAEATALLAQMSTPLKSLRITCPATTFIVDSAWKGLVGHRITINLPHLSLSNAIYRIIDLTVDIIPFQNIRSGFDAVATLNCVPYTKRLDPDWYAKMTSAKTASMLRKFRERGEE